MLDGDWSSDVCSSDLVLISAFLLLLIRLFYLQIIEGLEYRRLSENNCIRIQSIDPPRGMIFENKGELIVDNRPAFDVSVILKDAKSIGETLKRLASCTGIPEDELAKRMEKQKGVPSYKPVVLISDVDSDMLGVIEAHKYELPGIMIDVKPMRNYIHESSAAHILGYLGEINANELKSGDYPERISGDIIGKCGIEKQYDRYLRGERGGRQVEVDATGRVIRIIKTVPAKPGNSIYLTIDQKLQETAEQMLEGSVGAVVAIDPSNGSVLAMASSPTYNQNDFITGLSRSDWSKLINNPDKPLSNKAIQATYPPASTYKVITAIAGLEEGVIDVGSAFLCTGALKFGNRSFKCWRKGGHGTINIFRAISESCDVYFYQVGARLGVDKIAFYSKSCGLGEKTGIDLDNESSGLIPTADWKHRKTGDVWHRGETLSLAIGQGYNLVTPVQMATFIAAVANGGKRYRPHLLQRIETPNGEIIKQSQPELVGQLPIKKENLDIIKDGLWRTVNTGGGTAYGIHLTNIGISGKTGTAQVISRSMADGSGPYHLKPHAWFIAYAPSEAPTIAIAVIVEHGEHGSSAAAPVAKALIKEYLTGEKPARPAKTDDESDDVDESGDLIEEQN
jgi:penicillin-binding protein 2